MTNSTIKVPTWYWVLVIILLLWNLMGVASFYMHVFVSDEYLATLEENERALYGQYPLWTSIVFALSVFGGAIGMIGLLMRRKWAKIFFVISFIAIIIQMSHNLFITDSMEVYGTATALMMPIMVIVIGAFLIWFANSSIKKGWLS